MKHGLKYFLFCLIATLVACSMNGPQSALDKIAEALEDNNSSLFLANIDMDAYAENYMLEKANTGGALNSLNAIGNLLGIGPLDKFIGDIGNIMDVKGKLVQNFERGVASGQLKMQCATTEELECPWVPRSLKDATIVEIGENAAIARVTTPKNLSSWLALRKKGDKWLVVGQTLMESQARQLAVARPGKSGQGTTPGQGRQNPAPAKPGKSQPAVNI